MEKPSRALLTVFRAVLRALDDAALVDLRDRCIALGEHPARIEAIGREIGRRTR